MHAQSPPAAVKPAAAAPVTPTKPAAAPPAERAVSVPAALNLTNASLTEVIDILARDLKINYILDPKVTGKVTINTYGELRAVDVRNLLETILRMNGFMMVQVGNIYRIVPAAAAARLPVAPQLDGKDFGDTEQPVLDLIFLKYVTSSEMSKLLEPFMGEGFTMVSYDAANLLIIQDNSRNMKRTLELIGMFDSESMAGQRIRPFQLTNARPTDVAKELDLIFKAYSFSEKNNAALKFVPVDRINTVIAIAANPAAFKEVTEWIEKLDVPVKRGAGSIDNHVYKLKYGRAEIIGAVLAQLYGTSIPQGLGGYGLTKYGGYSGGLASGGGGYGGGSGGYGGGNNSFGNGGQSGAGLGVTGSNTTNPVFGNQGFSNTGNTTNLSNAASPLGAAPAGSTGPTATATPFGTSVTPGTDQTGQYLSPTATGVPGAPRIIPNPYDNTLLVQGTPQQWESILRLLDQLDVPPRQVLIDAKIFEVTLGGGLQYGVEAMLQPQSGANRQLNGSLNQTSGAGLLLSAGSWWVVRGSFWQR